MTECCNINCISECSKEFDSDIKDNFKEKGYIKIWETIYHLIAKKNINLTFEYIFNSNQSHLELDNRYVLSIPPNDYEKFLYINS